MAHYLVPTKAMFAQDIRVRPVYQYDAAMNVYGQRYFTKAPWGWPLLNVKNLGYPQGTNVGFMDGIPLAELVVKLFRHWLPPDFHSVYLWLALCWVLQPVAAVFALRSAGERRFAPNLAIAVIAISMPTLLFRFVHSSLCSHFVILIALGLYFRITKTPRLRTILVADALMLAAMLINPYIMEMVVAVVVAAPLSLLLRGERSWRFVAAGIGAGLALTVMAALLLGYGHAVPMPGFETFSMNLLSPIYPTVRFAGQFVDATGGQYEGYQYLGVGVILILLVADFCLSRQERLSLLRRHAGLVLACIGLTLLALTTKIYAGHRLLLDLPTPGWLLQVRSAGRLFWPVAYTLVIIGVILVSRKLTPRWAYAVLLVFASLQFIEANPMRHEVHRALKYRPGYTIDTALFRPLLASHSQLMVWPKFGCEEDPRVPEFAQLYLLASEVAIPVNMTYVGRFAKWPNCTLPEFPISVPANEMWVFVPQWNTGMVASVIDWRDICRQSGVLVVCAQDLRGRSDLPLPGVPAVSVGEKQSTTVDGAAKQWLASGWYSAEPWGTWSYGEDAYLAVNLDKPVHHDLVLTVDAYGAAVPPATTQKVTVLADGKPVATWDVKDATRAEYSAVIPATAIAGQSVRIDVRVEHPITPRQQGRGGDDRKIGFGLCAFRLDEQKPARHS